MNFEKVCCEWKKRKLPIINGVISSNGFVDKICVDYDENNDYNRVLVNNGRIEFDVFFAEDKQFSNVFVRSKVTSKKGDITVFAGGGSYGGDGFIVVESSNSTIIWLAFFEDSNEFERCEISSNYITAYNNLGEKWVFNIENPADLVISQS